MKEPINAAENAVNGVSNASVEVVDSLYVKVLCQSTNDFTQLLNQSGWVVSEEFSNDEHFVLLHYL